MPDLLPLLRSIFGHPAFRVNQEAVCQAATDGRDVLLVMPTGAGKSLCYQLPALARQSAGERSAALVVSPLIALMDDQAHKLTAAGLRVARIHSGLSRDDSRQACRDYLNGTLQFLFIAPERMRVPGFPEMLARRKPSLVAIDEAHCISAWGHDFRPDYRTLGDFLPALRPAPIIALTATATPTVQRDIATQLHLERPALFIHGFRRDNLAIEVFELSKPQRTEFAVDFLRDPARRPAIVYAPSRKAAEELAGALNHAASSKIGRHAAAAYHAGLDPGTRERVQHDFLAGSLEVVVATIAFGMGIDKANVRTVLHIALPASVEAFYQEIGRAGRDGLPSRTVLLWSYADRKTHEFFLERDYPVLTDLNRVAAALTEDFQLPGDLMPRLKMAPDIFARAVEKLAAQGVAQLDMAGNLRRAGVAGSSWQAGYTQQVDFRRGQIDRMMDFAQNQQCRMSALIRHFGDTSDAARPCGHCDFCNPAGTTSQTLAEPNADQDRHLRAILRALDGTSRATGKLFTDLALTKDRKTFDGLLDGLARAGLIALTSETFTNPEGNVIAFRKASLTHEGREVSPGAPHGVLLSAASTAITTKSKSRSTINSRVPHLSNSSTVAEVGSSTFTPAQKALETSLRAWRKAEAAKTGKPAFIVFGDSALTALVLAAPRTLPELLAVSGFGPDKTDRYGAELTAICRSEPEDATRFGDIVVELREPRPQGAPLQQFGLRDSIRSGAVQGKSSHVAHKAKPINPLQTHSQEQLDLQLDLKEWRATRANQADVAPFSILQDKVLAEIVLARPSTTGELRTVPGVTSEVVRKFGMDICRVINDGYVAEQTKRQSEALALTRPSREPDPAATLTPSQQTLEASLRAWRKSESERMGLPQFFVLGTSALRSIVLERPRTLSQLKEIPGIGPEKLDRFGASILELTNA